MGFYNDMTIMADSSSIIYFSTDEYRSYFAILSCDFENDYYADSLIKKGGVLLLDSVLNEIQLLEDKELGSRMPLLTRRIDKSGYPTSIIQYISRYSKSSSFRDYPLIHDREIEMDSVEVIGDVSKIIKTRMIQCYYYSLDSYENFSYEQYLKILESIQIESLD